MQTFSTHKNSLVQAIKRIRVFLTTERSIDWSAFGKTVSGYLVSSRATHDFHQNRRLSIFLNRVKPSWFVNAIRNVFIVSSVALVTYTYLAIERLPQVPDLNQPVHIYQIQDIHHAAKLFGHTEVDLSKVQLTGLMRHDVSSGGYAIFEVEGKNTGAIAVGETFDKGYFLKSIGVESVEIVFQGKQYQILMMSKRF